MPETRNPDHQSARDQARKDFIDPAKAKSFEQGFNSSPDFSGAWAKVKAAIGISPESQAEDEVPKKR